MRLSLGLFVVETPRIWVNTRRFSASIPSEIRGAAPRGTFATDCCALGDIVVEGTQAIGAYEAFVAVPLLAAAAPAIWPGGDRTPDIDSASGGSVASIL